MSKHAHWIAVFSMLLAFSVWGGETPMASQAGTVKVQARLIRASNEKVGHDPQLKTLKSKLECKFGYKYYHQLGMRHETLAPDKTLKLDLGEGFVLSVTPKALTNKEHRARTRKVYALEIECPPLVKSAVEIPLGGRLFIKGPDVGNDSIILTLSLTDPNLPTNHR